MLSITAAINSLRAELPKGVQLVAVSKFQNIEAIREAYEAGQRVFGESRVQELVSKAAELPADIEWHFIGHLQTNKLKQLLPIAHTIHAIDSPRLLQEIEKCATKPVRCLLQLHIAQEETKYGFSINECEAMLAAGEWKTLDKVEIAGIMAMASFTDDEQQIRCEFEQAAQFFRHARSTYFADNPTFCELSIGMSHDYRIAIEAGSTMVRIGTNIFGER